MIDHSNKECFSLLGFSLPPAKKGENDRDVNKTGGAKDHLTRLANLFWRVKVDTLRKILTAGGKREPERGKILDEVVGAPAMRVWTPRARMAVNLRHVFSLSTAA